VVEVVGGAVVCDDAGTVTGAAGVGRETGEGADPDAWPEAFESVGAGAPDVAPIAAAATVATPSRAKGTTHQRLIPPDRSTHQLWRAAGGSARTGASGRVGRSGASQQLRDQRLQPGVDLTTR
jgi:hypothetical protein